MSRTLRWTVGLSILCIFFYLALTYAFYANVATRVLGANDYYSRWEGARQFFLNGLDPYSDQVTQQIQTGMFGHVVPPNQDQVAFAYPFYAVFFTYPFISMPFALASSFWIGLLIMLIGGAAIALAIHFEWRLSVFALLGVLGFALFGYPSLRGIFLGQYVLITTACLAFSLLLLKHEQDTWAGFLLALATVKPHIMIVVLMVILAWGAWHRRWRLFVGFSATMTFLVFASLLALPAWLGEFVGAVGHYQNYIELGPPIQVLFENVLPVTPADNLAFIFTVLLYGGLLYQLWRTLGLSWRNFVPTIELALIVTTMTMIRTATTDQTLLLVPWLHWLGNLTRAGRSGQALLIASGILVLPWLLFLTTIQGNQEAPIATTGMVTLTLIAYVMIYWREWVPARRVRESNPV